MTFGSMFSFVFSGSLAFCLAALVGRTAQVAIEVVLHPSMLVLEPGDVSSFLYGRRKGAGESGGFLETQRVVLLQEQSFSRVLSLSVVFQEFSRSSCFFLIYIYGNIRMLVSSEVWNGL